MKSKITKHFFIIALVFLLCAILYILDSTILSILSVLIIGLFAGLSYGFFNGFFTPSKLIFKYRFLIYGVMSGIFLTLLSLAMDLGEHKTFNINHFAIKFIVNILVGTIITNILTQWNFNTRKSQTKFSVESDEIELFSDNATIESDDIIKHGRLILTSKRLVFISISNDIFDFKIQDIHSKINPLKTHLVPSGLILNESYKIRIRFPLFWIKQIKTSK